jgi:hypothetical protein
LTFAACNQYANHSESKLGLNETGSGASGDCQTPAGMLATIVAEEI